MVGGRRACLRQPRVSGARIDCPANAPKTSDCYFVAITGANFQFVGQSQNEGASPKLFEKLHLDGPSSLSCKHFNAAIERC